MTADRDMPAWGDSRSRSIWRWQLIFTATIVTLVGMSVFLETGRFGEPLFLAGAVGTVVLACASLGFPWHRVDRRAIAVLPLADIVAVGLLAANSDDTPLRFLWVFPIAWIATYYTLPWLVGAIGVVAGILIVEAFGQEVTGEVAQRFFTLLLSLGFIGVMINVGARRTRAYDHLLRRQFAQLDRTRSRAQLQAERTAILSDALETGLARIDRDGVLIDANAAFLRLYGAEAIAGFTPTAVVEYDARRGTALDAHDTAFAHAMRGERFNDRRVWLFTAAARWHALDVSTRPVNSAPGESPSNLLVVHDVTAAEDAARERRVVSSIVSHELRNPLTAILGHTELLQDRDDIPDDIRRPLGVIEHAAQRMQRMVTATLRDVTEAADGAEPVDLARMIDASTQAFAPAAAAAQVVLTDDVGETPTVIGDTFRLRQAIDNVIGNAVKYTSRGGSVRVSTAADDAAVVVSVVDTGIGMSQIDRERMFDAGFRSDTARASGISGTGLGMAITREIIAQHGGSIEVASELGRGTSVSLTLPRCRADEETS